MRGSSFIGVDSGGNAISPGRRAVLTLPLCQRFFGLSFPLPEKQPIFLHLALII